ncbi:hypothetical protein GKZ68_20810 (plasmid) [Hymenobacter sp. BRD128]|uniref:hypothetical protein n=1 Tax=Hymenobacter sp. BRD128 TaxID=2675878 RepID=UPI00156544D6|nr:hypothetical protein [Hymenobacter sp. BRD128]QKG59125.1 hypothetical protein GKZ68_20810 [Hymenobacter sp. BRD128]
MKNTFSTYWHQLHDALFEQPITIAYLAVAIVTGLVGCVLLFGAQQLDERTKLAGMLVCVVVLARVCDSRPTRYLWCGAVGILAVGMLILTLA